MKNPQNPDKDEEKARAFFAAGNFIFAEKLFRRIADAAPHDAAARYNLGVVLGKLDRLEEAMACYRATIELNPGFASAYTNFGTSLNELNFVAQARQAFAIARRLAPDNPIPVVNEGIAALAMGDYAKGWPDFAARWRLPAYAKFRRDFPAPVWQGEDLSGKTILIYAEQGFGDTIQMARYIPVLAQRGANVIVETPPALTRLIGSVAGAVSVIAKGQALPDFDFSCAMMDVPGTVGTLVDTIPNGVPYLSPDPADVDYYRSLLPPQEKRRVGLVWAGRASHDNNRQRSLPLAPLAPLFAREDVEWISLQRLIPEADKDTLSSGPVIDWGTGFADFATAAAAIEALDLVIAVDTAVAHLAGALGKPVWILLPFYADWRWLMNREDSPWYPTARLFRQMKRGEWVGVIERVAAALKAGG